MEGVSAAIGCWGQLFHNVFEVMKMNSGNISGLTNEQAKEFHEHWKHGVWSWVMIASAVHLVTWAYQPWF